MNKILFCAIGLLLFAACGGPPGNPAIKTPGGVSGSASVPPKFDANGHWKVILQDCKYITFADANFKVTTTDKTVQHFVADDSFDSDPGAVQGQLDVQSGDIMFCYNGTVDKCDGPCAGTLDASNKATMTCYDAVVPPPTCNLAIQKEVSPK